VSSRMAPTTRQQKLDASASNQPLLSGEETTPQDDSGDDYIDDSRGGFLDCLRLGRTGLCRT